jgi:hypothetical protein
MKYDTRTRTRQTFTLTGREHRGARAGNDRLVCHVKGDSGLLAVWGTAAGGMQHIKALEAHVHRSGYPVTIECDWIQPDLYEAEHFGHRYWVWETDHFQIVEK